MKQETDSADADRGQAYTLEGIIGAMVVLIAVLFALQSVVITPTTGGLADRTVQSQLQQEAQDALVIAAHDGNLSETTRNWNESGFYNATQPGPDGEETYSPSEFANQSRLGKLLTERFTEGGWSYNVELVYDDGGQFNSTPMVYQGSPPSDAITASYTVTLYDNNTLMADDDTALENASEETGYPIPQLDEDEELYNTVEVRVVLW